MGKSVARLKHRARGWLRLSGVDWRTYTRLLRTLENRPGIRLTYDRGELEIISPSSRHDSSGRILGDLVFVLTEELGLPLWRGGSTTLRRQLKQKGLESDECFWISHASKMAGVEKLDLRVHPPPDLAIEVDVTNSSLDRMGIYAALCVPEVWRLDRDALTFQLLNVDGVYRQVVASPAIAGIKPEELMPYLREARAASDQNVVTRQFREWLRQRRPAQ